MTRVRYGVSATSADHLSFFSSPALRIVLIAMMQEPILQSLQHGNTQSSESVPPGDEELYSKWKRLEAHKEFLRLQEVSMGERPAQMRLLPGYEVRRVLHDSDYDQP